MPSSRPASSATFLACWRPPHPSCATLPCANQPPCHAPPPFPQASHDAVLQRLPSSTSSRTQPPSSTANPSRRHQPPPPSTPFLAPCAALATSSKTCWKRLIDDALREHTPTTPTADRPPPQGTRPPASPHATPAAGPTALGSQEDTPTSFYHLTTPPPHTNIETTLTPIQAPLVPPTPPATRGPSPFMQLALTTSANPAGTSVATTNVPSACTFITPDQGWCNNSLGYHPRACILNTPHVDKLLLEVHRQLRLL